MVEYDPTFGGNHWQMISDPGGFTAVAAARNRSLEPVVFTIPDDLNVWENNPDFGGWKQISS
jgi:hypothetical protein